MASTTGTPRDLDQTPTWAVAGVCAVIIVISIGLEKLLHKLGTWLTDRHKRALYEALEKVKAELMILGFISLILVFTQYRIAAICIPVSVADSMLPCPAQTPKRRLLFNERRNLAAKKEPKCKEGRVPLISVTGLHQIHVLIFFLAVLHVAYCGIIMVLGRFKTRRWKQWEQETSSHGYEFSNDSSRFRLAHETSFVRAHTSFWTRIPLWFYIGCFFRQFFRSVSRSDYLTLRHGFITVHLAPGSKFDFQKYIKRSLEDDFKNITGISPVLWASFVVFLLLNVSGWKTLFWASLIPLVIILAIGTELQSILTKMAIEIKDRSAVVQGMPLVQVSDKHFWFGSPKLVLQLLHFALFQNAFQITYFLWIWYEDGISYCSYKDNGDVAFVITKLVLGVALLFFCSYITLPLYALVAQMGSHMKQSIFDEQTSKALKNWHMGAKKKHGKQGGQASTRILGGGSPTSSLGSLFNSTHSRLQKFKTTGQLNTTEYQDYDESDHDQHHWSSKSGAASSLIIRVDRDDNKEDEVSIHSHDEPEDRSKDFSFAKPATKK
ncbi:MLO-like protein 8 [Primulina huaijiensis]|uniref:MLO-like protein 8 n=1 Tax=Primulina huaijiensis TaxID=1492673 RepID=UPI003CC76D9F